MNNKKITIIFVLIAIFILLGIIGLTMAYFTSTTDFENEFHTALYQTEAIETFTSPENWLPGDTTPKELTITNTGNVDVKARVCITEEWTSDNGDTLPNEQNGERVAILNLNNSDDWTKKQNCYEYNDVLEPNDETSSFIESVTFNPNIEADVVCTTVNSTTTCSSSGDGYDNATYTLTLTVETVQANAASKIWNPFQFVNRQNQNQITVGDELAIDTEHFYVVSSDLSKTVLLSKYNLYVGDIVRSYDGSEIGIVREITEDEIGYGLQNSIALGLIQFDEYNDTQYIGIVPFSGTNYWDNVECEWSGTRWNCTGTNGLLSEYSTNGASYSGNPYPYVYRSENSSIPPSTYYIGGGGYSSNNGYIISYYVDNYINILKELGASSTISGRLLSVEEAESLGCDSSSYTCNHSSSPAPSWVYNTSYYLGSAKNNFSIFDITSEGGLGTNGTTASSSISGVRPVIEIPTSELN